MMAPVARELVRRGVSAELVSLAELRGLDSPAPPPGVHLRRVIPFNLRRKLSRSSGRQTEHVSRTRRIAQRLGWAALAIPMRPVLQGSEIVVVPNDAVFPYQQLIETLHVRGKPYVLMQEGIRFQLPNAYSGPPYARGGAAAVCVWGEGSAEYFRTAGVPAQTIQVTGTPRFDTVDPASWVDRGTALRERLGLATPPIALLTNPIEIQGYGTRDDKHALFVRFFDEAAELLEARGLSVVVKNHAHEDPAELARVFATTRSARWVHVVPDAPLFEVLAAARAAIVLTSTVGLESLVFGLPIAVLEVPGHEFAFEYVQRGAAVPLRTGTVVSGLEELVEHTEARRMASRELLQRHFHDRGRAAEHVADVICGVLDGRLA